jgi:hypothetical protein
MKKLQLAEIEKESSSINFEELQSKTIQASQAIANAQTAADVKAKLCEVWNSVKKIVEALEDIPVAGKYLKILADLLNTICAV